MALLAEFLAICRGAGLPGEVFHLKAAGRAHWGKMDQAIEMIERAREAGEAVTADVYPYPARSTGLIRKMDLSWARGSEPWPARAGQGFRGRQGQAAWVGDGSVGSGPGMRQRVTS